MPRCAGEFDGALRLSNALKHVQWHTPFGNPVVNGVRIAVDSEFLDRRFDLLPGPYAFEEELPPTMERKSVTMVALGGKLIGSESVASTSYVSTPEVALSDVGRERLGAAVREFLDGCVDQLDTRNASPYCPFGPMAETRIEESDDGDATAPTDRIDGFEGAQWEVAEYQTVMVERWWGPPQTGILTLDPGTASVRLGDGIVLECLIWMEGTSASYSRDGDIDVSWGLAYDDAFSGPPSPGCGSFVEVG
jgi:hypothetical protein